MGIADLHPQGGWLVAGGAKHLRIFSVEEFVFDGDLVRVVDQEGGPQLHILQTGWPEGPKPIANFFLAPESAAQLRAIADAVELVTAGDGVF